ncbi:MAG TPA: NAD-dependent succinate-semialdehyde dehydrogenase [Pirellulaceae bacterium]|nr:NAD-dependent succinate-semialdehyde dehydrogenase [Pirellulaceae bacterium]
MSAETSKQPTLRSIDPTTGKPLRTYQTFDGGALAEALEQAASAEATWRSTSVKDRCASLARVADLLDQRKEALARLATAEMGKAVGESRSEVEKCALVCRHYAEHAAEYLAPEHEKTEAVKSFVRFDPLGTVLAVMPWNFPYWQVFRCAAPILAGGNPMLLKHASNVTGVALAIEEVFQAANLPPGVFRTLLIETKQTKEVIASPAVKAVTLTGSEKAGAAVASEAGKHLKKCVLELGGSDPFVVLDDADLDRTIPGAVKGRMINAGQSCIASKRFLIHRSLHKEFVERFAAELEKLRVGDPTDEATQVGPLAREDLRDDLHEQVQKAIREGAKLITGGEALDRPGWFYRPTLLDQVSPGMTVFDEETFGPVAAVTPFDSDDDAVCLANATPFGLGASLWTRDLDRAEKLAGRIDAGAVFVNENVKSDPRLPFGGVKRSGYGRELSYFGLREFTNAKTVWIGESKTPHAE